MARSLAVLALACAATVSATNTKSYKLHDEYDVDNFFDKFTFFESRFDTGNYNDVDPTSGYVNYRNKKDAKDFGLIEKKRDEVVVKVDARSKLDPKGKGRNSVRLESKDIYTHGLFITHFSHLPKPACGLWPAYWMFGDPWPEVGELDVYESINLAGANSITLHTDKESKVGKCTLTGQGQSGFVATSVCDNSYSNWPNVPTQYQGQGCSATEVAGPWGSPRGGVYAVEWTSESISVWTWYPGQEPADIKAGKPDPRSWQQKPAFFMSSSSCDIDRVLSKQKLVLNIDFCGTAAGNDDVWKYGGCGASTKTTSCHDWVAANPGQFSDAYFSVKGIKIYKLEDDKTTSSSTASSTTSSTSTSATSSSTTTTSATGSSTMSSSTSSDVTASSTSSSTGSATASSTTDSGTASSTTDSGTASSTINSSATGSSSTTDGSVTTTTGASSSATVTSTSSCDDDEMTTTSFVFPTTTDVDDEPMVTSTIYTTKISTVTACPPAVPNCPNRGQVVTEVVALYTTVCPATETKPPGPKPTPPTDGCSGPNCPPPAGGCTGPNCPPPAGGCTGPNCPPPAGGCTGPNCPPPAGGCTGPNCPPPAGGCTGPNCPPPAGGCTGPNCPPQSSPTGPKPPTPTGPAGGCTGANCPPPAGGCTGANCPPPPPATGCPGGPNCPANNGTTTKPSGPKVTVSAGFKAGVSFATIVFGSLLALAL